MPRVADPCRLSLLTRCAWLPALALAGWLLAMPAPAQPQPMVDTTAPAPLAYPPTPTVDQTDTYHGVAITDPYRWLEDDNSADTRAWVQAQNRVTEAHLAQLPQRAAVRQRFEALTNVERFGLPQRAGGRYFWTRNSGLQPQAVLYTATALDAPPTVALDPNAWSQDGTVALTGSVPSHDGRLLAYGTARAGSDWQTWRVRDLATGQDLADELRWVKFSQATWTPDGRGFFYARYAEPAPGAALTGANHFQKLYYHRLGTPQADDLLVAENPADKEWGFATEWLHEGRLLVISVWKGSARRNGLLLLPLPEGRYSGQTPQPLTLDFDAAYDAVALVDGTLLLRTNLDAPRGRLIAVDLKQPQRSAWRTWVAQGPDALVDAQAVGGRLVLRYLQHAASLVRIHAPDGALQRELALPGTGIGTVAGLKGEWDSPETFYSYTSLTTPTEIHRLDVASGTSTLFKRPVTAFDPALYETRRAFVTSRDGTRFPVFIAQKKGLKADGRAPTLLYGYGGFNVPMGSNFGVTAATWLQMGGVWVVAATRGGGEYGSDWHRAGTQLNKQNVFDDFIAAAQWLIDQKITAPDRLGVIGGSNGGLLVGAVVNQRPELFAAAVPQVGVMDMLRFHRFTIGWAWVSDYGSSDDAAQFQALRAYSPLHNIRSGPGVRYPAVLVTTADHDDRVVPAHSFKYAAALQAADTGPAPKLIRIVTNAGHGAGMPTAMLIDERADVLSFVAQALGMGLPLAVP